MTITEIDKRRKAYHQNEDPDKDDALRESYEAACIVFETERGWRPGPSKSR